MTYFTDIYLDQELVAVNFEIATFIVLNVEGVVIDSVCSSEFAPGEHGCTVAGLRVAEWLLPEHEQAKIERCVLEGDL